MVRHISRTVKKKGEIATKNARRSWMSGCLQPGNALYDFYMISCRFYGCARYFGNHQPLYAVLYLYSKMKRHWGSTVGHKQ